MSDAMNPDDDKARNEATCRPGGRGPQPPPVSRRPAGWEPEYVDRLVGWLRDRAVEAGAAGAVFGLSGGIDSSVVAAVCARAFPGECLGLILPCGSAPEDAAHARLVADEFGVPVKVVPLDGVYEAILRAIGGEAGPGVGPGLPDGTDRRRGLSLANLRARLRAVTWYFHANLLNRLVVGSGNRAELSVGYFTKYGDGAVDVLPLGNLVKGEVRALARHLGVPEPVIAKPPTAGLWPGQTDEGEMGVTYELLDRFLLGGRVPEETSGRIREMVARSEHKRRVPAIPDF